MGDTMIRRRWLLVFITILVFLLVLGRRKGWGMFFARPVRREPAPVPPDPFAADAVPVGVAAGEPEAAIREALARIGGLEPFALPGKSGLLKPNVVSGQPHPATTNPAVVAAVVRLLREAGAAKVYVGDMSALIPRPFSSTRRNMEKCGIARAARAAGAEVVAFEEGNLIEVPLPGARYLERALVTEWLFKVDLVVNLPVIKTHRSASYSICLKNFIGCTHLRQRPYLVDADHWEELVAEFNLAFRPALHIVDGTVAMIEGGPWEGPSAPTGLIIASRDAVAADVVGLGIIKAFGRWPAVVGKSPWEQKQIRHALALGLGAPAERIRLRIAPGDATFTALMERVREFTGL
jgi:uncharacterized protein (DUF362 family)